MLGALTDFKSHVEEDEHRFRDTTGPLAMFHKISGPKILPSMQLLLRRPPYRPSRNIVPPWDDLNILEAATDVLEQHMQPRSAEFAPWEWKTWVQWHALAVVLAELIAQPHGHLSDRAYAAATHIFAKYTTLIADGDAGQLWKPIARLMHRVQKSRQLASKEILPHTTQATLGAHPDMGNALPQGTTGHFETFPFTNWGVQPEFADLFSSGDIQNYERLDKVYSTEDTQWLAWDCFLQDLNFPGA
ncbi:uncharacterized protein N0V89_008126 [Didymosphaeria variabile]|uniref:Uncharacterized protein n=1 Tax=Didymosphaeria variabile TaxID=1932322 RepID=A0A9W8XFQ2_9PLEO|nr:uncharacterized protein N0V89_008126 [Didymosphaeria variabile]KAJ4349510.1 hypothetical protein N0V89_008126 [Didymosphaeria variabile]